MAKVLEFIKTIGYFGYIGILIAVLVGMGAIIFKIYSELYKIVFIEQTVSNVDLVIGCCLVCVVFAIGFPLIKMYNNMFTVVIEDRIKKRRVK